MRIEVATDLDAARVIFREYADSLGVDLEFQDFEHELDTLGEYYTAIYFARDGDEIAGCVALRDLGDGLCEMKRLYIRPAWRGRNLGRALAEHVIAEAGNRDYKAMRLDTLPAMRQAMALYESLGFRDIEPYRFNPIEGSRFMELRL